MACYQSPKRDSRTPEREVRHSVDDRGRPAADPLEIGDRILAINGDARHGSSLAVPCPPVRDLFRGPASGPNCSRDRVRSANAYGTTISWRPGEAALSYSC